MKNMTQQQIVSLRTRELQAIVNSTRSDTSMFANELAWAKDELRRRFQNKRS